MQKANHILPTVPNIASRLLQVSYGQTYQTSRQKGCQLKILGNFWTTKSMFSASDCIHIPMGCWVLFADFTFPQKWCEDPFSNGWISYLLKKSLEEKLQTGPGAHINVYMWFRAKDLEPQNKSTLLDTEPVFTCFLNAYWTIHVLFFYGVCYQVLSNEHFTQQCSPSLLDIIVTDNTKNILCCFTVSTFMKLSWAAKLD